MSTTLTLAVLVLAASFGSWALSQWLAAHRRLSNRGLLLGAAGVICLIGAAAAAILIIARVWPLATPRHVALTPESPILQPAAIEPELAAIPTPSAPESPAPDVPSHEAQDLAPVAEATANPAKLLAQQAFHERRYLRAAQLGEDFLARFGEDAEMRVLTANAYFLASRYEDAERHIEAAIGARLDADGNPPVHWLRFQWSTATRLTDRLERARVQQALLQNYPEHRSEFAPESVAERNYVVSPHDTPPVAASQPSRFVVPGPLLTEWPTTECVTSVRDATSGSRRMFLDNECERAVALVFASCPYETAGCNASALVSFGWVYEAAGVVLTTPQQRPLTDRVGERGPLIAPVYAIDPDETRRRIRYLACAITDPEALSLLREPDAGEDRPQRLRSALERDACYARVLQLSRAGRESRRSPDALLAAR